MSETTRQHAARASVPPVPHFTTADAADAISASDLRGLAAGFTHPVNGAQATFRVALQALSHPGRLFALDGAAGCGQPPGMSFAMTALLLALADADTPVWLPPAADAATRAFFRFHCGCPFAATPGEAQFVAVPAGFVAPRLTDCAQGDPAYPDRSATLLLEVGSLRAGTDVHLHGPGIRDREALRVSGLDDTFWAERRVTQAAFPLGIDVFLACGATLCGLPRTTIAEN